MARLVVSSLLLLAGCTRSSRPEPSPPDPKPVADAEPATDAAAEPADDVVVDLEALAADPAPALPGTLVRHGRYDVRQLGRGGGFVVATTEEVVIHELGGRFVGRIDSKGDATPPSFLVFVTGRDGRLQHVIWRGLPGTGEVAHEFNEITARSDGDKLEITRTRGLSSSIQRLTISDAWTLDATLALQHLPLWVAARPEKAEWISIQLALGPKPERLRLAQRGKETIGVGGQDVEAWRYEAVSDSPLSALVWVDAQGFVLRRREQGEGDTQWDTIYVPLDGDRLLH